MLVRNENGSLCLEDETGQVPISVDDAVRALAAASVRPPLTVYRPMSPPWQHFHVGLFSTGSTVLAQGIMAGGTLSLQVRPSHAPLPRLAVCVSDGLIRLPPAVVVPARRWASLRRSAARTRCRRCRRSSSWA